MAVEETVKQVLENVIEVKSEELKPDAKLEEEYSVDSTEMVDISVSIKKELKIELGDNELKKTHSYNEIIEILKSKGVN